MTHTVANWWCARLKQFRLTGAGFRVLFEAQWIHRPASTPDTTPDLA